jgi:hypothetical protein
MFPIIPANSATASFPANDEGIFGFGTKVPSETAITNLVSNTGVVATDVAGVGTARSAPAGCSYGGDKGIFGFGWSQGGYTPVSTTNLVSNAGVVATDTAGVGTARTELAACEYGDDKGIFGYGSTSAPTYTSLSLTNLVSNAGVVASDQAATTGTARYNLAACEYGGDKGIFGHGSPTTAVTNLVSNAGVVATDVAGVGTARYTLAACGYGDDKGIFGFGAPGPSALTNLVSNTGVVATDTAGVGTARYALAATEYGGDKGIFGFGHRGGDYWSGFLSLTNLVSNAGVVASDQAATTGTARNTLAACSFN